MESTATDKINHLFAENKRMVEFHLNSDRLFPSLYNHRCLYQLLFLPIYMYILVSIYGSLKPNHVFYRSGNSCSLPKKVNDVTFCFPVENSSSLSLSLSLSLSRVFISSYMYISTQIRLSLSHSTSVSIHLSLLLSICSSINYCLRTHTLSISESNFFSLVLSPRILFLSICLLTTFLMKYPSYELYLSLSHSFVICINIYLSIFYLYLSIYSSIYHTLAIIVSFSISINLFSIYSYLFIFFLLVYMYPLPDLSLSHPMFYPNITICRSKKSKHVYKSIYECIYAQWK